MKEIIKTILAEWKRRKTPEAFPRETELSSFSRIKPRKIVAITGFRRVGKTYLLFNFINELLKGASRDKVVYINFEDERIPPKTEFLSLLLPVIKQESPEPLRFLFLDEIHVMPDWSRWLRRVYDTEDVAIFITGSSSKVSSREIPTELRGRAFEVNLFPLSFKEFLQFKGNPVDFEAVAYSEEERLKLGRLLEEYVFYGAMPEVVLSPEEKKFDLLQEYYRTVLSRDVIERYRIKNETGLAALVKLLMNTTKFSISKTYNNLKSAGYLIGKGTLQRYIIYLESSYYFNQLYAISPKIKQQLQTIRKIYFIDNGFISALSVKFSKNWGRLYENLVFLELKRRGPQGGEIFFWKNSQGREVDFVVRKDFEGSDLIQVCYDLDEEVEKREIGSLLSASRELNAQRSIVISRDRDEEIILKERKVRFIPLWKWLLRIE